MLQVSLAALDSLTDLPQFILEVSSSGIAYVKWRTMTLMRMRLRRILFSVLRMRQLPIGISQIHLLLSGDPEALLVPGA